jgi:hypothetical protein
MKSDESTRAALPAGEHAARKQQWAQMVAMTALYSAPALVCAHLAVVADPDVWWHLRTGQWILAHGALPKTEPFSVFGAGKPWVAYSWLFELLVFNLFKGFGITGIVVYTTGMVVAITAALHRLNQRLQLDFTVALLLAFAGSFCLISLWTPRSWLFSILFFVLELDVLMQARKTGKMGELYWLPLLFALWANLHVQFVIGLLALAVLVGETLLAHWWNAIETRISPLRLCAVSAACILATLLNPYGLKIYAVIYDVASQHGVMSKVSELQAIPFRGLQDYVVLVFALAAAVVVGRARRIEVFELLLLAFGVLVSFRSLRDEWVVVVVASAILAHGVTGDAGNRFVVRPWAAPLVAAATCVVVFLGFRMQGVDNGFLTTELSKSLPVGAADYVKQKGLSGPVYDDYSWGGYLIWNPGLPVVIDGRQNVYGDERINRNIATWDGVRHWASDPDLKTAGVVIGPVDAPLVQLLRLSPAFDLAYEDQVAAVFVPRANGQNEAGTHAETPVRPFGK